MNRSLNSSILICRSCLSASARASSRVPARRALSRSSRCLESVFKPALPKTKLELIGHFGPRPSPTHTTSTLTPSLLDQPLIIAGWLTSQRQANSSLFFFTLKDPDGSVQLVVNDKELGERMMRLNLESVVQVEGVGKEKVQKGKREGAEGVEMEVKVDKFLLLNPAAEKLPFYPNHPELANEDIRSQYRYLDLRRDQLASNIRKRSKIAHIIRCHLHDQGFTEVETPILLQSSPEGAREFLVPTRLPATTSSTPSEPLFYALPQSPQQPKQLLISSGLTTKYFQLARCFRDEDGRKDRQAEFTQVDIEMGFVSGAAVEEGGEGRMRSTWRIGGGEVRTLVEGLIKRIWREVEGVELEGWFRVMPYDVAMDVYGSDKPDTRFALYTLPIAYYPALPDADLDKLLADSDAETVEYLVLPAEMARGLDTSSLKDSLKDIERIDITAANCATWPSTSSMASYLDLKPEEDRPGGVEPGDILWLAKRKKQAEGGFTKLGRLRVALRDLLVANNRLNLPPTPHFLWITEFPLFTHADPDKSALSAGRWSSTHHPFTAPMWEDLENLKNGKEESVRGQHYDLVLNGVEIGGGSVRVHDAGLQEFIMREVLELEDSEMQRFGHLLQALKFGAPPHAGIALGLDRLVSILCQTPTIRDVIAFPKTSGGGDPVFRSPSGGVGEGVLAEYGLKKVGV